MYRKARELQFIIIRLLYNHPPPPGVRLKNII